MGKVKQNLDCDKCKNQILECSCHYQGPQYDIYTDKADMLTAEEVQFRDEQLESFPSGTLTMESELPPF